MRGLCAYDVIYDMRIPCICADVQGSVRIRESAAVFPGGSRRADHARAVPVGCSGENTGLYAWSHAGISLAVAAAYGAVMIVATWLTFRKRDLR